MAFDTNEMIGTAIDDAKASTSETSEGNYALCNMYLAFKLQLFHKKMIK